MLSFRTSLCFYVRDNPDVLPINHYVDLYDEMEMKTYASEYTKFMAMAIEIIRNGQIIVPKDISDWSYGILYWFLLRIIWKMGLPNCSMTLIHTISPPSKRYRSI